MNGTYWLTVLPETSKLRPGIKKALAGVDQDATIRPKFDTKTAKRAGQQAGRELQSGVESETRGGLGKMLRIDGARSTGQNAGREINAGLQSANIGSGASAQLERNMTSGAAGLGRRLGSMIGTGLKVAAVGAGTIAAAGLGAALHAGFSRLTAIDDAKFKLQGLGNSAEQVQSIMDNALAAVKGTAFGLDEAATTAASAVAAGIKPGEELTGYLKLTADTAAIAGTNLADMGGIFNSVQTSGKAMTGDLRMLADRGLPVFTWLQEATGKTGEDFTKFVEEGGISAELFRDAVAKNIAGAAQNMGGSVRGSLSNLKASFSRFGAELSGPIFAGLKPLAIGLTGVFDSVTASIKPIMADLTARVGPWAEETAAKLKAWADNGGLEKIVTWFGRLRDTIASLRTGEGRSDAIASITESAKQLGPALQNAGPALQGLGESAKAFGLAIAAVGPEVLTAVLVPALQLLAGALKFVADNASWAVPVIGGLVLAVAGLSKAATVISPVISAFSNLARLFNAPLIIAQTAAINQQAAAMNRLSASLGTNTVAQNLNTGAQNANTATTLRGRAAALASAAASKVAAGAQWLWNAALTANPITLIIAGVAAAGVAIWAFFTKTETGRKLWDKIWTGIKTTFGAVWSWLKTTLATAWQQIGPSVMKIADVGKQAFGAFGNAIKQLWTFIQPAIAWVGRLWLAVGKLQFQVAIGALKALGSVIGWLWTNVVVPAFSGIATAIETWWAGAKIVWSAATTAAGWLGDKLSWLWQNVAVPAFEGIGSAISTFWDGAKKVWSLVTDAFDKAGKGVGVLKDAFVTAFNAIKDVVTTVWNSIKGIIDGIRDGLGGVVDKLRNIPGIGALIPGHAAGNPPGFAGGRPATLSRTGRLRGPGTGTSDSILAMLSNGEGVVKESAMRGGGAAVVAALNAGWVPSADFLRAMLPGFAEGLNPGADFLRNTIMQQWPSITSIGGRRSEDGYGEHSSGNALDIMIPNYSTPAGKMLGDEVASWIAKNRDVLGADGMIWRQTSFGYGGDWSTGKGMSDRGSDTQNHMDHVHVILGKGRGAGAPAVQAASASSLSLPAGASGGSASALGSATSAGGGSGIYRSATDKELAASAKKLDSANEAVRQAEQSVDDRTYSRDKAQRRLDELRAKGKDTTDAEHSLEKANRELEDANRRLAKARDKAAETEQADSDLRSKGVEDAKAAGKSGNGYGDLGSALWGGLLETIGLDGSVFSNPFEWPTVKSVMAGVNWLGKAFLGDGSSGDAGGILGGMAEATGLDSMLTNLNPAANEVAATPASAVAPDTTTHGAGAGAAPGPAVVIQNAGMSPVDVSNRLTADFNARTRTTKVH
ncbi:tape measure protein [Mycobacterium phage Taheera]|uniref:Tape measure protein n=1 Tax=Mycobacterium phage Taheera TaxID=1897549 RepID=A0A1D8EVR2_9CAUD|nr:endolysin [Mycobacterium phage Taheera]AOT25127.1 tape measure protein [Mycobacterium phage Taheera]